MIRPMLMLLRWRWPRKKNGYKVSYWDGYSLAEIVEDKDLKKSLKAFKRLAKKLAKNLRRFSQ